MRENLAEQLDALLMEGDLSGAERLLIGALKEADEAKDYMAYAEVAAEMVRLYQGTRQFDKAEAASNDLLLLLEELGQEDSDYFAMVLITQANGYRDSGRESDADNFYERAARILDRSENDALKAVLLTERGTLSLMGSRAAEAEALFRGAAGYFESADRREDPRYIFALAGIAETLAQRRYWPDALSAYERVRSEVERQDGRGRSFALLSENCAAAAAALGDEKLAEQYRQEAVDAVEGSV